MQNTTFPQKHQDPIREGMRRVRRIMLRRAAKDLFKPIPAAVTPLDDGRSGSSRTEILNLGV